MAIRKVVVLGENDAVLRAHAQKVTKFDRKLHILLRDMADTMYEAEGIGIAAPQVNVSKRVVVIDIDEGLLELVNPKIVSMEGETISTEGCLSVPGRRGTVKRPERVVVRAQNRNGIPFEIEATELLAVALCHEIDHLDGTVYVDKMIEDVTDKEEEEEA